MNDATAIETYDLSKTYRDGWIRRRSVQALSGVSLTVERGEIFGLLGPNGAGKTTLIKILLGLVRKSAGDAQLLGRHAGDRRARRRVGYLPEHHRIPAHLTGDTALEYYGSLSNLPVREIRRRRPDLMKTVGLGRWGRTNVRKYSKGMLQRLGLAQAMLHDPDLLILDEPTDGVDPVGRAEIREILHRLKAEGKTIFLNSHLLQEIELVCDRVAILGRGKLRRVDSVRALTRLTSPDAVFVLGCDDATAREALNRRSIGFISNLDAQHVQVNVELPEQSDIDACIDDLRRSGISIASVARRHLTLEQAFLKLVQDDHPER